MRGKLVIVRAYGDKPLARRVWDLGPGVVYIHDEEQFQRHLDGDECLPPVGFPIEDVFEYDAAWMSSNDNRDWSCLKPWRP